MKIYGIGTDIINITRMKNTLKRKGEKFKQKYFSVNEIKYCEKKKNPSAFFAKRFAAKEAFTKALGTGIGNGISIKDIEISNNKSGKPFIKLKGKTDQFLKKSIKRKKYNIYLSLSDDEPWAQATVIISHT